MPTPSQTDLKAVFGLPPEKAIEYVRNKGYAISWNWRDLWQESQARAFTVARVMSMDVLQDIRGAVDDALANGTTLRDFQKNLTPILQAKGWWGPMIDQATGEITTYHPDTSRAVEQGSPRRLKTIYQTNLQTAYMAGRYQQMMANTGSGPGKRNWWMYEAVMDKRTRPSHAALNGKVFRFDDPIWDYIYPPNGFNCRCRVRPLSDSDLKTMGITPSNSDGYIMKSMVKNKAGGEDQRVSIKLPGMQHAFSPDLGWAYNQGKAQAQALAEVAINSMNTADKTIAGDALSELVSGTPFKMFFNKPEGNFPIGILQQDAAKQIGSKTQTVILSAQTMLKQLKEHPELTVDEYAIVQDAVAKGEVIQDTPSTLIFLLQDQGYVTVVKATKTGNATYLTSFRRLSNDDAKREREIQRLLEKGAGGGASQPA